MSNKRIIGLDLLRIFAAFTIMTYHYFYIGPIQGFYSNEVFHRLCFWGEFGVDVFFLLSGFVILISTEYVKSSAKFLIGRAKRIYPAYIICSLFTMFCGFLMPDTNKVDLFHRWLNSLMFYSDVWGGATLSNIYWTLLVEIKFYILVAIIMKIGIWKNYKYQILFLWCLIAIINNFSINNNMLNILFNLKYAGHFTLGIILYLLKNRKERSYWMGTIIVMSVWLIYRNMLAHTNWIRSLTEIQYTDIDIFLGMIFIISVFILSIEIQNCLFLTRFTSFLGALSYTFYLIHADFGYFIRTQYYIRLVVWFPNLLKVVNEHIIMLSECLMSFIISVIFLKISTIIAHGFRQRRRENNS